MICIPFLTRDIEMNQDWQMNSGDGVDWFHPSWLDDFSSWYLHSAYFICRPILTIRVCLVVVTYNVSLSSPHYWFLYRNTAFFEVSYLFWIDWNGIKCIIKEITLTMLTVQY